MLRRRVAAPGAPQPPWPGPEFEFAFQSGDMANPRDFMRNISRSIEAGLDKDIALRALTLTPAEIFGVADRFGSLEKGKTANLVVATGDLFDSRTRVKHVFIDGAKFDIPEPESSRARGASSLGYQQSFRRVDSQNTCAARSDRSCTADHPARQHAFRHDDNAHWNRRAVKWSRFGERDFF